MERSWRLEVTTHAWGSSFRRLMVRKLHCIAHCERIARPRDTHGGRRCTCFISCPFAVRDSVLSFGSFEVFDPCNLAVYSIWIPS